MRNRILKNIIIFVLFFFVFSCKKSKEGNTYSIKFSPTSYSGATYGKSLYFIEYTEEKLKVKNLNCYFQSVSEFNLSNKKISGVLTDYEGTDGKDTICFKIEGSVSRKKIFGNYEEILSKNYANQTIYGTFEIDLTKKIKK